MQLKLSAALSAALLLFSFNIHSDDHMSSNPVFVPVEIQQCNFANNKDMDDFLKLIPAWNDLLDEYSQFPYSGWTVIPHYRSGSTVSFDFAWLGVSDSWENFGSIYDAWFVDGSELAKKFDKIRTCETQTIFGSQAIRPAKTRSETGVMLVSNCTLKEGTTPVELAMADSKWNEYLDSIDSEGGIYRWFPGPGAEVDAEYTFKNVLTNSSMTEWGKSSEIYVNGGGIPVQMQIYGDMLDCDAPRMYQTSNMRDVRN